MTRRIWKANARAALGGALFASNWLVAVLVMLLVSAAFAVAGSLLPGIGALLITGPLLYGQSLIFLRLSRGSNAISLEDLIAGFRHEFTDTVLLGLLTMLFTALWSLLLVIPGILKYYSWTLVYYVKIDHPEYDWRRCMQESAALMRGHRFEKFLLDVSFIGWGILGALCFGVGTLWVTAYTWAAEAEFYAYVKTSQPSPEF
ncbi:MAG: DUF975 family protein [Mailhella sp.]|nr:DUF975 family protein [Mailhella sp.]